jgi:formylmethanofuran dehydrogenase subunit A
MDRDYRAEMFKGVHGRGQKGALLSELDRVYTLYEIAIITRAGTARALGLKNKGHLGVGADADIAIYEDQDDKEKMFARPRYVIKDGVVVARDGEIVCERPGRTLYVSPPYDPIIETTIRSHFQKSYTVSFDNYSISEDQIHRGEMVPADRNHV